MKISCQSCGAKYNIADEKVRGKIVKIACKKCGARIEIDGREPAEQAQDNDETRVFDQAVVPPAGAPTADSWTVSIDDNDQRELTTAQLAELYAQGVVTPDTFVWRDGMADWQAVRDVAALQSALAAASAPPAPAPAYSEPPTAASPQPSYDPPAPSYDPPAPIAAAAAAYGSPQIETSQPARLGGSRRGGAVDLFAQSAAPAEDEDVATSAPVGPSFGGIGGGEAVDHGKPLGARNENSVLFSLSALTASGPAPAAAAAPADDEKSGLIDIQKLAASAKTNGAKDERAKLDDIMNLGGGGAFGSALGAPILAPPPAAALTESPADAADGKKGGNKGLLIAVAGLGVVVVALLLVLVLKKGDDDVAKAPEKGGKVTEEPSSKDKATKDKPEPKDTPKDEKVATPEPTTAPAGETPPEPTGGPIGKAAAAPPTKGDPGTAAKGTTPAPTTNEKPTTSPTTKCTSLDCMMGAKDPPKKEEPKPAPAAGGGEIDKAAVKSALGGVPYKDCGSGGAGKVQVTFGPNGKVSSASVTSGSYDAATKSCIAGRFKSAKVPAYGGDPKSFAWSINL